MTRRWSVDYTGIRVPRMILDDSTPISSERSLANGFKNVRAVARPAIDRRSRPASREMP